MTILMLTGTMIKTISDLDKMKIGTILFKVSSGPQTIFEITKIYAWARSYSYFVAGIIQVSK